MSISEGSNKGSSLAAAYRAYARQSEQQENHQSIRLQSFEYQSNARSRQLDTLLHLSLFSDHLVLVSAPPGAGKSTFIEQFIRRQPAGACILHLALTEPASSASIMRQLVQQLPVRLPDHASLETSIAAVQELAQQLTQEQQVLLVVVDDAHWLDDGGLGLLANLLPGSVKPDARPHVILCSDQSLVERIEAPQFSEMRQQRFYHLVLTSFNQEESADYLRQRLQIMGISQGQGLAPIQLLQLHQLSKGNPGYLNMLTNKALHKGGFVQQMGWPLMHIAATIVVVCMLSGIWLFNYVTDRASTPVAIPLVAEAAIEAAEEDATESALQALPPLELSTPPVNISLQPVAEPVPVSQLEPVVMEPFPASPLPSWPKATAIRQQSYGYAAFMELPPQHYTLQVLGARLESTLEAFLVEHKLTQPYYVLQLVRGDAPWYLLLSGDYQSSGSARNAIQTLPLALRNQQPWPRQVLNIQQQIRDKFNTSVE